jgi:hypothetical protein
MYWLCAMSQSWGSLSAKWHRWHWRKFDGNEFTLLWFIVQLSANVNQLLGVRCDRRVQDYALSNADQSIPS